MEDIDFPVRLEELRGNSGSFRVDEDEVWTDGLPYNIDYRLDDLKEVQNVVLNSDDINFFFNAISHIRDLNDSQRRSLNEALHDLALHYLEICQEDCQSATLDNKICAAKALYLLIQYCTAMERVFKGSAMKSSIKKSKSKSLSESYIWPEWRTTCFSIFHKLLSGDTSVLFAMGLMPQNFSMLFWKYSLELLEEKVVGITGIGSVEQASKKLCTAVLLLACKHVACGPNAGVTVLVTALLDAACRHEHLATPLAEVCQAVGVGSPLVTELMTEVSRLNMSDLSKGNGTGVKNIGCFLIAVSSLYPELIALYLPLIMHHMDSDAYQIRCAIITSMGSTIAFIHRQSQSELNKEQGENSEESSDSRKFNMHQLMRLRDDMIDMLIERTHDVNAFARAAVLRVWVSLVETEALPVARYGSVAEVALNRLDDKTAVVRKCATQLLTTQLEFNPFSGSLNASHFADLRDEIKRRIKDRMDLLADEVHSTTAVNENNTVSEKLENTHSAGEEDEDLFGDEEPENTDLQVTFQEDAEIVALSAELGKCVSCLELLESIHAAVPKIGEMFNSRTNSDVLEALRFFTRTMNFGIKGSATYLHQSFSCIWHQDESVQLECLQTFSQVYVSDGGEGASNNLLSSDEIAQNLIRLALRCSTAELTSVEKIIGEIFARAQTSQNATANHAIFKKFSKQAPEVINSLWHIANVASQDESCSQKMPLRGPLLILKMISNSVSFSNLAHHIFPSNKINVLCKLALDNLQQVSRVDQLDDIRTIAMCLQATSSHVDIAGGNAESGFAAVLAVASEKLSQLICDKYRNFDNEELTGSWFGMCEEAVNAIFHVHPTPDVFLGKMIMSCYSAWVAATSSGASNIIVKTRLARFLFLCGQGALSLLLYTEKIANVAKKARELKDKSDREVAKQTGVENGDIDGQNEVDDMEEEMGLTAVADAEHDREFTALVELELVSNPDNLLGSFHPFIAYIVANGENEYCDPLVREAAVLALCRYMSVSSVLCEEYLPLLFTVLERETNEKIRTSIIIATGDLSFRFPNSVEPWTAKMYDRLSDECLLVRYNALMVLTHLILNDMIKVKGQVSAVVMCLNDSSEKVCSLARLFFTELSKRSNNPVYNLLGDIISSLSRDKAPDPGISNSTADVVHVAVVSDSNSREHRELTVAEFHSTMQFLLSFVTKDKQADSLLERLLIRMAAAVSVKQRRNLAFCISQLPITDKGVKRMTELLRQMKDCLLDADIMEYFKTVVSKAKKTGGKSAATGGDVKEAATEFDEFVASVLEENNDADGENSVPLPSNISNKKSVKSTKKTTKKNTKRRPKKVVVESCSESESEAEFGENLSDEDETIDQDAGTTKGRMNSSASRQGIRC